MAVIYLAAFVIRPWEMLAVEWAEYRPEYYLGLTAGLVVLLSGRLRINAGLSSYAVYAFLAALGIATMFSLNPDVSFNRLYLAATVVVFYVILISVIRTPYDLIFIIACFVLIMGLYLAKAQWEYFIHGAGEAEQGYVRLKGIEATFGDPNSLGPGTVFTLPLLVLLATSRKVFSAGWSPAWRKGYSLALLAYVPLAVTTVLLTRSRSGAACLFVYFVLESIQGLGLGKKIQRLILVGALCVAGFFVLPEDMQHRIRTIWNPEVGSKIEQESAQGRWLGFQAGVDMFRTYPMTGVGPAYFKRYRFNNVDGSRQDAHNLFGQVLGETGLVGATSFGFLVLVIWLTCRRLRRLTTDPTDDLAVTFNRLSVACFQILVLLLVQGLVAHNLYRFNWLWIAAFSQLALMQFLNESKKKTPQQIRQPDVVADSAERQFAFAPRYYSARR